MRHVLVILLLLMPFSANAECARECPELDIAKMWEQYDIIFAGRVQDNRPVGDAPIDGYEYGAGFEVYRGWKGVADGQVQSVRAKHHPRLCTTPFEVGQEYIVFAQTNSKGNAYTDIGPCTPDRLVGAAREWVNALDGLKARMQ